MLNLYPPALQLLKEWSECAERVERTTAGERITHLASAQVLTHHCCLSATIGGGCVVFLACCSNTPAN